MLSHELVEQWIVKCFESLKGCDWSRRPDQNSDPRPSARNTVAVCTVADEQGHVYYGYRIDWNSGFTGGYYGIEGMNWTNPPLFKDPTEKRTIDGRQYLIIDDGSHIHDIGWIVGSRLYWVSNTLLEDLTNDQMLGLARSAAPLTG